LLFIENTALSLTILHCKKNYQTSKKMIRAKIYYELLRKHFEGMMNVSGRFDLGRGR